MEFRLLSRIIAGVGARKAEKPEPTTGKKRKKPRPRRYSVIRPMIGSIGSPTTRAMGATGGHSPGASEAILNPNIRAPRQSRASALSQMRRGLGFYEWAGQYAVGRLPTPRNSGILIKGNPMVDPSKPGPLIHDPRPLRSEPTGGLQHLLRSPGINLSTEIGWRIWREALLAIWEIPTLTNRHVLARALSKAGVFLGQVDPTEIRVIEMGIEWAMTDSGMLSNRAGVGVSDDCGNNMYRGVT